jgi:cytochrome c-type biogenesis protein CcmH/NrfF
LAHAQGAETEEEQARRAMELNREIMSPFCPGRTLDGCSSSQAGVWREEVRRWVAEGKTNQEIKKLLAARTDKDLTGAPSTAMDSVLPVLVIVVALLVLIALLRVLVKPDRAAKPKQKPDRKGEAAKPAEDYDQRLDDELAGLDD